VSREELGARQLFWTAFLTMFPTILVLLPGDLLRYAGRFAWWTPLLAGAAATLVVWALGAAAGQQGGIEAALSRGLGPVAGRLLMAVLLAALAAYTVVVTREYAQLAFATFVFENVPLWLLTALGLGVAGMAAWLGLTVIARGAEITGPLLLWVHLVLLAAALAFSHVIWARPLLPTNTHFARPAAVALTWVWLAEPVTGVFMMEHAAPGVRRRAGRLLAQATALAAGVTAVGLWVMVADFGPARAAEFVLPMFNLTKEMTLGSFLQHFELVLIAVALLGGAGKMAIFYWLVARAGRYLTRGGSRPWLLAALLGLGAASVFLFSNVLDVGAALRWVLVPWALPALVGGVALAYAAGALRRRRSRA
jgi:hypothetical protein